MLGTTETWGFAIWTVFASHPSEFDLDAAVQSAAAEDVAAAIGSDERRMQVRAYNYWVSLLQGRDYPSIEDLDPGNLTDFAPNSVLLDFTGGRDDPATPYIGAAIREECGLSDNVQSIADIPSRSLLSRLTDHYLQIIANRAPVGFEAEFVNLTARRSSTAAPHSFSSNGDRSTSSRSDQLEAAQPPIAHVSGDWRAG